MILNKRLLVYAIGIGSLISNSMILYITFIWAYFSGHYTVTINEFGEASLEMIVLPLSIIIGVWTVFHMFRNEVKNENQALRSTNL